MEKIGDKIKRIRNEKGFTQEELAEKTKVNLRTIQRLESNRNQPRANTLKQLCSALDIPIENIVNYGKEENLKFLVYMHLSVLLFCLIPTGNIIIPLILWMNNRDKIIGVDELGKNILNFQILLSLFSFLTVTGGVLLKIQHYEHANKFLLLGLSIYLINTIFPALFSYLTKKRKKTVYYPNPIRFIR